MLNMIFRDIHPLWPTSYLEWVQAGDFFGETVTDELGLYGGFLVEVLVLLVLLPLVLTQLVLWLVNSVVGVFVAATTVNVPPINPDEWCFLVIGMATLAYITWSGSGPIAQALPAPADESRHMPPL